MEKKELKIITLFDNYQVNPDLQTGWGFSALVKINNKNILFDTGADGDILLLNMDKMGINVGDIDAIFLSHAHGDHIGGLEDVLEKNNNVEVFIPASFSDSVRNKIKEFGAQYQDIGEEKEIFKNVYSTGQMEGMGVDEQGMILKTDQGLVLITGCAHPGVVEMIKKTEEIFKTDKVYLVLGGFHLSSKSDDELRKIIEDFKNLKVEKAGPCHCSGERARELFEEAYGENYIDNGVGKIINLDN